MWSASILWMVLIAIESTNWLSADNTSRILYPIFHFFTGVDAVRFVVWDYYIRKVGHFCGYFGLSFLLFGSWRATLRRPTRWSPLWAAIAFLMTVLVASLDEWHQTYLVSRTGSIRDVVLDSTGALIAQVLIFLWIQVWRKNRASVAAGTGQ
jgi:VanZ family protein